MPPRSTLARGLPLLALALLYVAGAVFLATIPLPLPPALLRSEAVHVPAHMVLYGGLALLAYRRLGSAPLAVGVALAAGVLQELAQVLGVPRAPGLPELFDLLVDATAASLVVFLAGRAGRSPTALSPDRSRPPGSARGGSG
jgi:hypothetical protein